MSDLTPAAVKEQRRNLRTKSPEDHLKFLAGIGHYLRDAIPSTIDNTAIVELEAYLNDLYQLARVENWTRDVQTVLFKALSYAAELSDIVKKAPGRPRPGRFFAQAKKLGETLELLEVY